MKTLLKTGKKNTINGNLGIYNIIISSNVEVKITKMKVRTAYPRYFA